MVLGALALLIGSPSPLRADWLVHLPVCAMEAPHVPTRTRLVYPRPGLPALVRPGEVLVARVQLPVPLTPPPGLQQPKALRGWRAELLGQGHVVEGPAEHRYDLRVEDVRPDADRTLVYRARVRVPPWAAPGTYALAMDTPGSTRRVAVGAVRVVAPGARPILRRLPAAPPGADLTALRDAAVDVWVASDPPPAFRAPLLGEGVPWLDLSQRAAVVAWEGATLAIGGCDDPGQPFEATPRGPPLFIGAAPPWPAAGWERVGQELREHGGLDRQLTLLFPEDGRGHPIAGARYFSATGVRPAGRHPSVAVVVPLPAGGRARLGETPGGLRLRLELPARASVQRPAYLRARTSAPAHVAVAYEEDGAAYGPASERLSLRFRWLGPQEVHALALGDDGATARAHATVTVAPVARTACSASRVPLSGGAWVWLGLCAIVRRR